uniref:GOLD domain-containing protein n=1 Tax=Polytomella parva TaxID=51329 RepID=A0A7S0V2T3_9CHLO|mmetsp:Transcript_29073/g.53434  ORF Transcript_29073/g.53434 Transcript_29073/m.53434 type:complete len:206 (+) Transcript_29073:100-717(+)
MKLILFLILTLAILFKAQSFEFDMHEKHKCIFEEIGNKVIVVGDFKSFNTKDIGQEMFVDVKVLDPHHDVIFETKNVSKGQFAFTSKLSGEYQACFSTHDDSTAQATKIYLDWKTGVAARDWESVAKKEHLDALTVELRRLEDGIREVYSGLLQLQTREQEMREISEETNTRVAWYSVYSLLICISSGIWQLWYLRRFFQRKKIL